MSPLYTATPRSDDDTGRCPSVRFNAPGAAVTGVVYAAEQSEDTDLTTGQTKTFPDGSPRPLLRLRLLVTASEGAVSVAGGDDGDDQPVEVGGKVSVWLRSRALSRFDRALIGGADGELVVGVRMMMRLTRTIAPRTPGYSPAKVYAFAVKPPQHSGPWAAWTRACQTEHDKLAAAKAEAEAEAGAGITAAAGAPAAGPDWRTGAGMQMLNPSGPPPA